MKAKAIFALAVFVYLFSGICASIVVGRDVVSSGDLDRLIIEHLELYSYRSSISQREACSIGSAALDHFVVDDNSVEAKKLWLVIQKSVAPTKSVNGSVIHR